MTTSELTRWDEPANLDEAKKMASLIAASPMAGAHAGKPNDRRWRELSMTIGSADTIQDLPIPQGRRGVSTPDSPDVRRRRKNT